MDPPDRSSQGPRFRLRKDEGGLVLGILIAAAVGILLWRDVPETSKALFGSRSVARGFVVEAGTGRPIPGATILIRSHAHPIPLGDLRSLFIENRHGEPTRGIARADSAGRFRVDYEMLDWSEVSVVAPGYVSVAHGPEPSESLLITLRPKTSTATPFVRTWLHGSFRPETPSLWIDVDSAAVTSDSTEAELAFIVNEYGPDGAYSLQAIGSTGLHLAESTAQPMLWERECDAPTEGYVTRVRFARSLKAFLRLVGKDDRPRYGRVVMRAGVPIKVRSEGYFEFALLMNPTGTREVCPDPPEGEPEILAEIDSARAVEGWTGPSTAR